jgi:hypothetical protein
LVMRAQTGALMSISSLLPHLGQRRSKQFVMWFPFR